MIAIIDLARTEIARKRRAAMLEIKLQDGCEAGEFADGASRLE
jgi:hypothetical protein